MFLSISSNQETWTERLQLVFIYSCTTDFAIDKPWNFAIKSATTSATDFWGLLSINSWTQFLCSFVKHIGLSEFLIHFLNGTSPVCSSTVHHLWAVLRCIPKLLPMAMASLFPLGLFFCLQNREICNWEAHLIKLLKISVFIILIVI